MTPDMQAIVQRLEEVEKQVAHLAALATFDDLSRAQQETMLQRDRGCLRGAWSWRRPEFARLPEAIPVWAMPSGSADHRHELRAWRPTGESGWMY